MLSTHVEKWLLVNMDCYLTNCDYKVESSHISVRRGEGRTIQISNGSFLQTIQKHCLLLFILVAFDSVHLFEKKMNAASDTNFGSSYVSFEHVIDTKRYNNMHHSIHCKLKACIIRQKIRL